MARYARMLDKPTDAADFETLAAQVNDAFQKQVLQTRQTASTTTARRPRSILPLAFGMVAAGDPRPVLVEPGAEDRGR